MILYLIVSLPALILGIWARSRVQRAFRKYSKVPLSTGLTGAQVADRILAANNLSNVRIEPVQGMLSDHYDPRNKVLRLSPDVYNGRSVAAAGVAAHEVGHALQDADRYAMLGLRSMMVPTVQLGSWAGPIIFIAGALLGGTIGTTIAWVGVGAFMLIAAFTIVTLPVEFNASARAKKLLTTEGIAFQSDLRGVDKVLDAAALTYVAAAVQAVTTVLYYVWLLSGRRQ